MGMLTIFQIRLPKRRCCSTDTPEAKLEKISARSTSKNAMKSLRLKTSRTAFALLALIFSGGIASAEVEIVYPDATAPIFSIKVPKNWTLTKAETLNDFFLVAGPKGVDMWFRAKNIESAEQVEKLIESATKSGKEWLAENYSALQFGELVAGEANGRSYFSLTGSGVDKKTEAAVTLSVAFFQTPNGALAQFWCVIPKDDAKGPKYVEKVLNSFTAL